MNSRLPQRNSLPERAKLFFFGDPAPADSILLSFPSRRLWMVGVVMAIFFVIMASIAGGQMMSLHRQKIENISDLSLFLFQLFWILGWSVGVFILGALTFLFLFYKESARLQDGQLFCLHHFGPLCIRAEYDLEKIQNLRLEMAPDYGTARIHFDYDNGSGSLGDILPEARAKELLALIQSTKPLPAAQRPIRKEAPSLDLVACLNRWAQKKINSTLIKSEAQAIPSPPVSWKSLSTLALVLANLWPLAGVIFWGWDISEIMILFWAESAVIGFYNIFKLFVVGKWLALFSAPFFVGHYGGFMSGHFLFVYFLFIRGIETTTPQENVWNTLSNIFLPLWPALLTLFISHGISFWMNFLKRKEYLELTVQKLMTSPYQRIFIMHITIIFGGWLIQLLHAPLFGLLVLILLKTILDLRAHHKEHAA